MLRFWSKDIDFYFENKKKAYLDLIKVGDSRDPKM